MAVDTCPDDLIVIEHGASRTGSGWWPWMTNNGHGGVFATCFHFARDEAEAWAEEAAREEASRYAGDWRIYLVAVAAGEH